MPPPTSPLQITSFPFSQTITVAEAAAGTYGGTANQVWCEVVCADVTALGYYATSPGFNITTNFYYSDGSTLIDSQSTGTSGWIQLDVDTYYIRFTRTNGAAIPNNFVINFDSAPFLDHIEPGWFLVNDDTNWPSSYPFPNAAIPAVVYDMDGNFQGVTTQVFPGEIGDSLPDGTILYDNRFLDEGLDRLVLVDNTFTIIADFDTTPPLSNRFPAICNDGTNFYVLDTDSNAVFQVSSTGTVTGPIATLPFHGSVEPSGLGISRDGLFLYFTYSDLDGIIHQWDIMGGTEIAPFYTIPGFVPNDDILAVTPNGYPGEILCQSDGSVVTYWHDLTDGFDHLIHISSAGTLLNDISYARSDFVIDHIHYSPSQPLRVYVYFYIGDISTTQGRFTDVVLADGSEPQGFTTYLNSGGTNQGTDTGVMFAPSTSCFMATLEYGSESGTGTLVVVKVVVGSDPTATFDFTAGGGLSPTSFTLGNAETQNYFNLTPGSGYTVEETLVDGWTTTYEVSNGSPIDDLLVTADEVTTVTVTNSNNVIGQATTLPIRWVLRTGPVQ